MDLYYVNSNAQSNGDHEVHRSTCSRLPDSLNRVSLWLCKDCKEALRKAKSYFDDVDGCYYCCNECHTS